MRTFGLPALAVAALAVTSSAMPAFAGNPYYVPQRARSAPSVADVTNPGLVYAQPNGAGVYSCQLGEKRTRLQRRACGPLKNSFGD